jgi:predicted nucleic acid-binding protein
LTTYFDTSAIVPLLIDEPASARCRRVWNDADQVTTSTLAFVEVHTALAQAHHEQRMTDVAWQSARAIFDRLWDELVAIAPAEPIIRNAAGLGSRLALRGYDAVHCATALAAASDDFVAITGGKDLLRAWSALGIATIDTAG